MNQKTAPAPRRAAELSVLACGLLLALPALAQTTLPPPDAGQTLRELQRPIAPPRGQNPSRLTLPAEIESGAATEGQRFSLDSIRVEGATKVPEAELQALLRDLIGRPLSLAELRQGVRRIGTLYRERGYVVARAYLPPQEVADGALTVRVLEGELGRNTLENQSRLPDSLLQSILDHQMPVGEAVRSQATDRALLLLADLPGAGQVGGNLRPGERVGSSDLLARIEAGEPLAGDLSLDNTGNRYTGRNRLSGRFALNNPLALGDRLELRATLSDEKLGYGRLAYDVAAGVGGLRVGAALSSSRYELAREFAALEATGTARSASLYGSYPLLRSLQRNVWISASIEKRQLRDESQKGLVSTAKSAEVISVEVYGDAIDALIERSYGNWRIGVTSGTLDIKSASALASDAVGPRTQGGYIKLQGNAAQTVALTQNTELSLVASGQAAGKNLDSSEKFVLGGAYGVRAYPQGEASGDSGWLATIELRQRLLPWLQASAFVDQGQVRLVQTPYTREPNRRSLRGYGLGASASVGAFSVRASVAWRDGTPATSAPDRRRQLWLQSAWRF